MIRGEIIPDILTDSLTELREKVRIVQQFTRRVHVDVIDGVFAHNTTVMPVDFGKVDWGELMVDVQLMVKEPVDYLMALEEVERVRVIGHVECLQIIDTFVARALESKMRVGLGLNLETGVEVIPESLLTHLEAVLLMSVPVGFSGQKFEVGVLEKVTLLRQRGFKGDIVMDGGMNEETILQCLRAGANQFAVNSSLWQTREVEKRYQQLLQLVTAHEHITSV